MGGLLVILGLGLGACGGGGGGGVASAGGGSGDAQAVAAETTSGPASDDERRLEFAKCMRENGVDVPDPEPGVGPGSGRGMFHFGDNGIDPEKFRSAAQECRKLLPNGGEPPKLNPEQIEQFRKLASCMRGNGVADFPDPDPDGRINFQAFHGMNRDDPDVRAAFEKCREFAPFRHGGATAAPGSST